MFTTMFCAPSRSPFQLEIGNVRSDHDRLLKAHDAVTKDKNELTAKLTETSVKLRERDTELKGALSREERERDRGRTRESQYSTSGQIDVFYCIWYHI